MKLFAHKRRLPGADLAAAAHAFRLSISRRKSRSSAGPHSRVRMLSRMYSRLHEGDELKLSAALSRGTGERRVFVTVRSRHMNIHKASILSTRIPEV